MASRHRAHTSVSVQSRPQSRASTTSATSQHHEASSLFAQHQVRPQDDIEAQLLQELAHREQSTQPHLDDVQPQQAIAHQHAQNVSFASQPTMALAHELSYGQPEASYPTHPRMGSVPLQSGAELTDTGRRKGSAVTATNDKELRELLARNEGRPLRDVAQEVIQKERTPMAEKTKQLFAMLWLRAVCKPAKTSVPRNRVYLQYANRCGTERVIPLNPASFGKLVRVIFPGIQTRRLGVRGESKYHYVDLGLEDESQNPVTNPDYVQYAHANARPRRSESVSTQQFSFNGAPPLQADTSAFPVTDASFDMQSARPPSPRGPPSQSRAFAYPDSRGMRPASPESISYPHALRFPSANLPAFSENEPVQLPQIEPFLPPRTDPDTAESLFALYRTHCTSLIDSIRFCKEKQFFRLYTSFHGTLTVPVQKLFTHPALAPWIEQCDLIMYRTMVRFVSRLTLQAAPVVVINILSNISANLHGHIAKTFSNQPPHVLDAKLRPATVFARLLYRLIRVNQSAHAAANLLTIDQNREQMWREWVMMVNPKRVMEAELPDCGYEEVYKILTTEMRSLLEPLSAPAYHDDPYGFGAYDFEENGAFAQFLQSHTTQPSGNETSGVSTENVLDRWSTFIALLSSRFPQASARMLLHCISAISTAALRDITIAGGQSYGHWWVLKIFVDEMALWLAEMGGFLELDLHAATVGLNTGAPQQLYQSLILDNAGTMSHHSSHRGSVAPDAANGTSYHTQQAVYSTAGPNGPLQAFQAPAQGMSEQQQHQQQMNLAFLHKAEQLPGGGGDIDDSGIGMSLMEDDVTVQPPTGQMMMRPHGGMNGVVVPQGMSMQAL